MAHCPCGDGASLSLRRAVTSRSSNGQPVTRRSCSGSISIVEHPPPADFRPCRSTDPGPTRCSVPHAGYLSPQVPSTLITTSGSTPTHSSIEIQQHTSVAISLGLLPHVRRAKSSPGQGKHPGAIPRRDGTLPRDQLWAKQDRFVLESSLIVATRLDGPDQLLYGCTA